MVKPPESMVKLRYSFHGVHVREVENGHATTASVVRDSTSRDGGLSSLQLEARGHGLIGNTANVFLVKAPNPLPFKHKSKEKQVASNSEIHDASKAPYQKTPRVSEKPLHPSIKAREETPHMPGKMPHTPKPGNKTSPQKTWIKESFCDNFLTKTFQLKAPVCSVPREPHLQESVDCFGSPHSSSMGTCTLRNIVVSPSILMRAMYDPDRPKFEEHKYSISLLRGLDTECEGMTIDSISKRMEGGDYVLKVVQSIMKEDKARDSSVCDAWINETVFFYTAHRFHIFFRFLDYYNIHKLVGDLKDSIGRNFRIIRISGSDNYHFPEFDRALFPDARVQALEDLNNVTTCFKKVILVPKSYASPIFQCKNRVSLRTKCSDCNGKGLRGTDISKFSERVVKACSSGGKLASKGEKKLLIVVSRTPYLRNQNDKLNRFERILENEDELVKVLQKAFVNATVVLVHLENLTICKQITYGHNADVYIGVHGSGLVHLWWMRDDALLYEMEPHYQIGNPTFRMLSILTGRRYHNDIITGSLKTVHTDVKSVVDNIRKYNL